MILKMESTKNKYKDIIKEFQKIGRAIFLAGLNNSHSGNISVRVGNKILITRRTSMLGFLEEKDIIETGIEHNDSGITLASTEIGVHRAIYKGTSALAIIHTHPLTAVSLSFLYDEIIPIDVEGSYILRKIPVAEFEFGTSSKEMEEVLPGLLKNYKIVLVRGHGSFAIGHYLEEALHYASTLENIAQIIYRYKMLGGNVEKLQKRALIAW